MLTFAAIKAIAENCLQFIKGVFTGIQSPKLLLVFVFIYCPYLLPGEPCLRKQSSEGEMQDEQPARKVGRFALTGNEEAVEALSVASSAQVVSGGAFAAEKSPSVCQGELSIVSSSVMQERNRPCPP